MTRLLPIGLCCLTLFGLGFQVHGAPHPNDVSVFMKLKLPHAHRVLDGIIMEDYDLIAKSASQLGLLSQEANWNVLQTPEYLAHSVDFRRAVDALSRAARDKDADQATLAYMDMTLKCVNCHKYVRDARN
ncbi:MAG: cytochrome c [Planctomycetes bacterium]|nr:cytochrome c [Planctomycetota bacterium]